MKTTLALIALVATAYLCTIFIGGKDIYNYLYPSTKVSTHKNK